MITLVPTRLRVFRRAWGALFGHIDGVSAAAVQRVLDIVTRNNIGTVILDGSNLGELARAVKRAAPAVRVVVFFHNVEARFFWGALRQFPSTKALAVLVANASAERKAVRYADVLITLSQRDSAVLRRLYGRGATHVSPIALADRFVPQLNERSLAREPYLLFVGGAFYANQEGISWYARHVAPRIRIKTLVVGHGMEAMRPRLEAAGNIEVVGAVESLAPWYHDALAVVAPIFDGSGMKTKVAEALMFGKRVIGTAEAFSGYDEGFGPIGQRCDDADGFVKAINELSETVAKLECLNLRQAYCERYSENALRLRWAAVLAFQQ